jgi:hypothetical protein
VVIGTPSGLQQIVDVLTGEASIEHDMGVPITCIQFCSQDNCLLVGCEDGSLTVLGI